MFATLLLFNIKVIRFINGIDIKVLCFCSKKYLVVSYRILSLRKFTKGYYMT